ncbi:MAG: thiaminase II [Tissierellales bacterium]|jgi:thiaminase/transcriptional activator TenA|nr:thiaminase II [Tissierellales bacterium]
MGFSEILKQDKRVQKYHESYMRHPFVRGLANGNLDKNKFRKYLIQDTLYLKDYAKVYAYAFLLGESIEDLQFLHTCIGVVMSEETNMHIKYLNDFGLNVYEIDNMEIEKANRDYLDYMLGFSKENDMKSIFVAALACTLTYEYIGKQLKYERLNDDKRHYYDPWIDEYAGKSFESFSIKSCELIDRYCADISLEEQERLIDIYIKACEYEMGFWDMSFEIK